MSNVRRNYIYLYYIYIYHIYIVKSIVTLLHLSDLPINRFQRQIDLYIVALTLLLDATAHVI